MRCPRCDRELAGLARYCADCEEYTADMPRLSDVQAAPNEERAKAKKQRPPLEEAERLHIKAMYEAHGCKVVNYSQAQRAQQTKGIPDLQVFHDESGEWWYHEVKRQKGPMWYAVGSKQSEEQVWFEQLCERFGIRYVCGAREVAEAELRRVGAR